MTTAVVGLVAAVIAQMGYILFREWEWIVERRQVEEVRRAERHELTAALLSRSASEYRQVARPARDASPPREPSPDDNLAPVGI